MKNIKTQEELMRILNISNIADIDSNNIQNKFIDIVKNNEMSVELFKDILEKAPALTESFNQVFKTMGDIGNSLEETKRHRWNIIKELGEQNKLSGSEILEAMNILREIEKEESIDWNNIFQKVLNVAVVALVLVGGASFAKKK